MKDKAKKNLLVGFVLVAAFVVFTLSLKIVDVKSLGVNGTEIGFSAFNCKFHKLWGVNMTLYTITDWAGLAPIFVAFSFGVFGLVHAYACDFASLSEHC